MSSVYAVLYAMHLYVLHKSYYHYCKLLATILPFYSVLHDRAMNQNQLTRQLTGYL